MLCIRIVAHLQAASPLAGVVDRVHAGVDADHMETGVLDLLRNRLVVLLRRKPGNVHFCNFPRRARCSILVEGFIND